MLKPSLKKWTKKNEPKSRHSECRKTRLREIKTYVKSQLGEAVWNDVIGLNPEAGKEIEELKELGQEDFRARLVRQTRIISEFDDREVLIHMFIHTKRDFRTHPMKRLFDI